MHFTPSILLSILASTFIVDAPGLAQGFARRMDVRLTVSLWRMDPTQPRGTRRIKIEDKRFGLIAAVRHEGVPRFTKIELDRRNELRLEVAAEFCDGTPMTWFLVQGMASEEDVDKFLDQPDKWTWGQINRPLRVGSSRSGVGLIERGTPIWARGRMVGPRGKPVLGMDPRVRMILPDRPKSDSTTNGPVVGYHPDSGRIWVQGVQGLVPVVRRSEGVEVSEKLSFVLDVEPRKTLPMRAPSSGNGLAAVHSIPLPKDVRLKIRIPAEAILVGKIKGPDPSARFKLYARIMPTGRSEEVRSTPAGEEFKIHGLMAGTYDLRITGQSESQVLVEKKGLVLEEGKTLQLADPLDVMSGLLSVKISIADRDGKALDAIVDPIFAGTLPRFLRRRPGGNRGRPDPSSADGGVAVRLTAKQGGEFAVHLDGYAPRILTGVKDDTSVVLHRAAEVRVRVSGLPAESYEGGYLVLRAEPPDGYSDSAWNWLNSLWRQYGSAPGARPGRMQFQRRAAWDGYCQSKIPDAKPVTLRLTHPGKWRFTVIVLRSPRSTSVSQASRFVLPQALEVVEGSKELELTISPEMSKKIAESVEKKRQR